MIKGNLEKRGINTFLPWCLTWHSLVFVVYLLTRAVFHIVYPMDWAMAYVRWQHLDLFALKTDYWGCLWNCHMQPPLFNALLGGFVIIVPDGIQAGVAEFIYFVLGCLSFVAYRRLLRCLVGSDGVRLAFEIGYVAMPSILFAERWFGYTLPVLCCLLWMACALVKWVDTQSSFYFCAYLLLGLTIVSMRSFFHPIVWFLPCCVLLTMKERKFSFSKKTIISIISALAVLPSMSNFLRWGVFTPSTWQGMNLARTLVYVTPEERKSLIADGSCPPIMLLPPFSHPEEYMEYYGNEEIHVDSPVLSQLSKTWSDVANVECPNFNHLIIPRASKDYQQGWISLVHAYPGKYLLGVLNAAYCFFTFDMYHFWSNAQKWLPCQSDTSVVYFIKFFKAFVVPVVLICLYAFSISGFVLKGLRKDNRMYFCLYCLGTCLYTFAVAILAELGENNIMRVPLDPILLIGAALFADAFLAKLKMDEAHG